MKNFKKVLALVLVLATLLGLATMAGAATEYKDADKIDTSYDEAIKVLDLIETMQGYPNGEFRPTANITREEAAKLIAIFDNKDADISTYYTSINPFADEKGRWGESYVGYGYRAGIIAGMSDVTVVVESDSHGGALVTASLANAYGRDVAAVPGRPMTAAMVGGVPVLNLSGPPFAVGNPSVVFVQDHEIIVPEGVSNRKPGVFREFPVNEEIGAAVRGFRRAILIDKGSLRKRLSPHIQLLDWHDFSPEHDHPDLREIGKLQSLQIGQNNQLRRNPVQNRHLFFFQEPHQEGRERKIEARNHAGCASVPKRRVNIQQ